MNELHNLEKDRIHMKAPIQWQEISEIYTQDILSRFQAVHEQYIGGGKTREKYMQRIDIEFKHEVKKLTKSDIELIDSFFEHKRWSKQKERNLVRDL